MAARMARMATTRWGVALRAGGAARAGATSLRCAWASASDGEVPPPTRSASGRLERQARDELKRLHGLGRIEHGLVCGLFEDGPAEGGKKGRMIVEIDDRISQAIAPIARQRASLCSQFL